MYATLGDNVTIQEGAVVGHRYRQDCDPTQIGADSTIRSGTIIYGDVTIGKLFQTGHHVLVREQTRIGDQVVLGTNSAVDGQVVIGNYVKIETAVYIPTHTEIGDHVFIGPAAVMTNDMYPQRLRDEYEPIGPILEDNVTVGANATLLPGVRIGEGSMVAAGSVVTGDIPEWSLAVGVPARVRPLPDRLKEPNRAKTW